jgi:FdhD protein
MADWAPFAQADSIAWRDGTLSPARREVPEEVPVAVTYDGSTYAVMMATPSDLEDFATGFSLTEEVIDKPGDIDSLEILPLDDGIEARIWLKPDVSNRQRARRRSILGPTGCGLCGAESITQALKPVRVISSAYSVRAADLAGAMRALESRQSLNSRTRAVHAAGIYAGGKITVREDVGRHNALDKVIGASVIAGTPAEEGIVLLTSRVSVELVQKTAWLGAPIIAAVSAPTALAIRMAKSAGITLAAILRGNSFEIFTFPERIVEGVPADVA